MSGESTRFRFKALAIPSRNHGLGMTLVEVTLSTFLGGMALIGLSIAYAYGIGVWENTERKLSMHADGTLALENIIQSASGAESFQFGSQRLELVLPESPLDKQGTRQEWVYRLTEQKLWANDSLLIPSPGDSGIAVAEFKVEEQIDVTTGLSVLGVRICLYSKETAIRSSDSMWFESQVHLRNRGLTQSVVSGLGGMY